MATIIMHQYLVYLKVAMIMLLLYFPVFICLLLSYFKTFSIDGILILTPVVVIIFPIQVCI